MSFNIEVRKKQLQSLDQYINASKNRVHSILAQLGWNAKQILEKNEHVTCPINLSHKIPLTNIDKHVRKCCLKSSGYDVGEEFLPEPSASQSSISLDNNNTIEILNAARNGKPTFRAGWNGVEPGPLTVDRLFTTFSTDERLALYDYCVKNTEPPPTPSEFIVNVEEKVENAKDLTPEEMLQKERNAKRRRIKYKSVHTGRNKSYTEVMREVINNQMELYQEYVINTSKLEQNNTNNNFANNGNHLSESYTDTTYIHENFEKIEKSMSDKVSSIDSSYGPYTDRDEYNERGAKEKNRPRERTRRREDDRDRNRSRRSRSRERRDSRIRHRNGYDRHHDSHRRSDRDRRH